MAVLVVVAVTTLAVPGSAQAGEVVIEATGAGRVTSDPPGIDCRGDTGGTCRADFGPGEAVTLTAEADAGGVATWDERCRSKTAPGPRATCTEYASGATGSLGVSFTPGVPDQITVTIEGNGGRVVSDPAGISCPETCEATFPRGTVLQLRAIPVNGFFGRFPGCSIGASRICEFTVDGPRAVTATFRARDPRPGEVRIHTRGHGIVAGIDPPHFRCPVECIIGFPYGSRDIAAVGVPFTDVTDTPRSVGVLDHWEGECARAFADARCRLEPDPDRPRETTAVFRENAKLLAGVVGEGQIVTVSGPRRDDPRLTCAERSCAKRLRPHSRYVFRAVPARGHEFARWTGWCSRAFEDDTCTITEGFFPNARVATTAEFRRVVRGAITVAVQGDGRVRYGERSCTTICIDRVEGGDSPRYAAEAGGGWEFDRWDGCPAASGAVCRIGSDRGAHTIRAVFSPRVRISFRVRGMGRVTGGGLSGCTSSCSQTLAAGGGDRTFTASPAGGWTFDHWEGYCSRAFEDATCRVRGIHRDESAVAVFRRR